MADIVNVTAKIVNRSVKALIDAFSHRNRRVSVAVLLGGATIAAANWYAMSQPAGESVMGLGSGSASGAVVAPAYGGVVTGVIAGFSRRPVFADARAGTFAAFAGVAMLLIWVGIMRLSGDLPAGSAGFARLGPISGIIFVLVIGAANVFFTFPTAFLVMFASRSVIPNNRHRYGWLGDDEHNPGPDYVTPCPVEHGGDLSKYSTAYSRFSAPPRFSKIPKRFLDGEPE